MVAAISRAIDENKMKIFDPNWQSSAPLDALRYIFREDETCGPIPLLEERLASLHQLGRFTNNSCNGNLVNLIRHANGSAMKLIDEIVKMSMWNDVSTFHGENVQIMKRAQLLIADLWYCANQSPETEISKLCKFSDISELTGLADYRVPQSLLDMGVITYSDILLEILKTEKQIEPNDPLEVEIRGVSL